MSTELKEVQLSPCSLVVGDPSPKVDCIAFCPCRERDWAIKITSDGIIFNHEAWPEFSAYDFSRAFIRCLEDTFGVTFSEKFLKNTSNGSILHSAGE